MLILQKSRKPYLKQDQALQKFTDNNGHMKFSTLEKKKKEKKKKRKGTHIFNALLKLKLKIKIKKNKKKN